MKNLSSYNTRGMRKLKSGNEEICFETLYPENNFSSRCWLNSQKVLIKQISLDWQFLNPGKILLNFQGFIYCILWTNFFQKMRLRITNGNLLRLTYWEKNFSGITARNVLKYLYIVRQNFHVRNTLLQKMLNLNLKCCSNPFDV